MTDDTTITDDTQDQRDADTTTDDATEALGDAGKAALKAERDARKAADKRARDAEKKLADLETAKAQAAEQEATQQGKWEELATTRKTALDELATDRDAVTAERDEYRALVEADVTAAWKDLPEEVRDAYEGDDDDVLGRKRHMVRMAKVIARLTDDTGKGGGSWQNPNAAGARKPVIPSVLPAKRLFN